MRPPSIARLLLLLATLGLLLFPLALLTSCGGGGLATRSAGNISISAGDNAVVTLSDTRATQEAAKTIDAAKVAAAANTSVTGQGSAKTEGTPTATLPANGQPAPTAAPVVAAPPAPVPATPPAE